MDNSQTKKRSFFKDFFKSGYFFGAIATACFFSILILLNYNFDILVKIHEYEKKLLPLALSVLSFVGLLLLIYLIISAVRAKMNYAVSVSVGLIITAILYLLYVLLILKEFTVLRIAIVGGMFGVGLIYTIIYALTYNHGKDKDVKKGYFTAVFDNYTFPLIIFLALFIVSVFYIYTNREFNKNLAESALSRQALNIGNYVALGALALAAITTVARKKVTITDALLIAACIAILPIIAISIFINKAKDLDIIIPCAALVAILFIIMLRKFVFYKSDAVSAKIHKSYLGNYFEKYNFSPAIAAGVCTGITFTSLYACNALSYIIKIFTFEAVFTQIFVPITAVAVVSVIVPALALVFALIGIKAKKTTLGDFAAIYGLAAAATLLVYALILNQLVLIIVGASVAFVFLLVLICRIAVIRRSK